MQAIALLLGISLARGSVSDLLAVVHTLLTRQLSITADHDSAVFSNFEDEEDEDSNFNSDDDECASSFRTSDFSQGGLASALAGPIKTLNAYQPATVWYIF